MSRHKFISTILIVAFSFVGAKAQLRVKPVVSPSFSMFQKSYLPITLRPTKTAINPLLDLRFNMLQPSVTTYNTYCAADLAFFCRIEVKLEKTVRLPVLFRLGDVQYVNYLEGKTSRLELGY